MGKTSVKAAVRQIAGTVADPTLPKTPVTVGGKTYNLCFDLGALAEAEDAINAQRAREGREPINLLADLPAQSLGSIRRLFAASVRVFHPEISYDAALELLQVADVYAVGDAVMEAWKVSTRGPAAEQPKSDPTEAGS